MSGPVPVTLPRADVRVADDGVVTITVDGTPWPDDGRRLTRTDLSDAVARIVRERDTPVRFDITDSGRTYTDILTPAQVAPAATPAPQAGSGILGTGFVPGELVRVAVVVATATAGPDGVLALRVPPALQGAVAGSVVLIGAAGCTTPATPRPASGRGLTSPVTGAAQTGTQRPTAPAGQVLDRPTESSLR